MARQLPCRVTFQIPALAGPIKSVLKGSGIDHRLRVMVDRACPVRVGELVVSITFKGWPNLGG